MLTNLLPRIMGFIVIIITLALSPTIYTANGDIAAWGVLDPFVGLEAIAGFGAFIIIFGLLVGGGLFAVAGVRGQLAGANIRDVIMVVGSVILIIVMLAMFVSLLDYVDELIDAAIVDGDTIGEVGFGLIPIIIYVGILASAGWAQVSTYRKLKKGGKGGTSAKIAYA